MILNEYKRRLAGIAALLAAGSMLAIACGGGSDNGNAASTAPPDGGAAATVASAQPTQAGQPTTASSQTTATPDPMAGPGQGGLPASITVRAGDNFFSKKTIEAAANKKFKVTLENDGVLPHNLTFFNREGGDVLGPGANGSIILEGETSVIEFTTPGPGTYFFVCVVHPDVMKGDFIVK